MKGKNLPCWKKFNEYLKQEQNIEVFGFECKEGDISRINARYRLSKSFKKVELDGFSNTTVSAYSAIMKVFLVYSVFENYLKCIYGNNNNIPYEKGILILKDYRHISNDILRLDKKRTFYELMKKFVNDSHKRQIDKFYNEEEHNIVYLISSIRHAFVHGKLSANFNHNPLKVIKICNLISEYFLEQIASNFAKRICGE